MNIERYIGWSFAKSGARGNLYILYLFGTISLRRNTVSL